MLKSYLSYFKKKVFSLKKWKKIIFEVGGVGRPKNMSCRHLCPSCERNCLSSTSSVTFVAATYVFRVKVHCVLSPSILLRSEISFFWRTFCARVFFSFCKSASWGRELVRHGFALTTLVIARDLKFISNCNDEFLNNALF